MKNVLVICAHPDDETLGLGGTLALESSKHTKISLLIFTDGESARGKNNTSIITRQNQAKKACSVLGIQNVHFLDYQDQKLDSVPVIDLAKCIESYIKKYKPDTIFTHFWGDVNQDHRTVFEATLIASRPTPSSLIKNLFCYEIPSSTEWSHITFTPNYFVNIEKTISTKISAFKCYIDEVKKYPHPCSLKSIKNRSNFWGSTIGSECAESFILLRHIT